MDDRPTSHVLGIDSVSVDSSPLLPLTDDPPPPPFDYPPKAIESNAALGNKDIRSFPSTSTSPFQPFPERSEGHANPSLNLLQPSSSSRPPDDLQIGLPRLAESRVMVQEEGTADQIGLKDLKKYMNFPIGEAAKRLGVCPSIVKKACRRNGLPRWPYREIRAINESIAIAVQRLEEVNDPREKDELLREIADLRNDKELACQGNRHGYDHSEEENDDY